MPTLAEGVESTEFASEASEVESSPTQTSPRHSQRAKSQGHLRLDVEYNFSQTMSRKTDYSEWKVKFLK